MNDDEHMTARQRGAPPLLHRELVKALGPSLGRLEERADKELLLVLLQHVEEDLVWFAASVNSIAEPNGPVHIRIP